MAILFTCTCGRTYRARDELAGRNAVCRDCGKPLVIPAPAAEEDLPEFVLVAEDAGAPLAAAPEDARGDARDDPQGLVAEAIPVAVPPPPPPQAVEQEVRDDLQEFILVPLPAAAAPATARPGAMRAAAPKRTGPCSRRRPERARANTFTYPCPNPECDAIMESEFVDIGKEETCPSCHRRYAVPQPPPPSHTPLIIGLSVGAAALVATGVVLAFVFLGPRGGDAGAAGGGRKPVTAIAADPRPPKAVKPPVAIPASLPPKPGK